MALKISVKVSGISDLSNARYCAGMGVDFLGFDMDNLPLEKYQEIKNWVIGPQIVGFTKSTNLVDITEKLSAFAPDILEIESAELYVELKKLIQLPIICGQKESIQNGDFNQIDYFKENSEVQQHQTFFDATGKDISILPKLLEKFQYVNLTADSEERPGFSNFDTIMDWLEALEIE